jgi:branched-chain amino acid aminotransferase
MREKHLSAAQLYGKGIFTTIAIQGSQPFLWDKHWQRLSANADSIGIDLSDHREPRTRANLQNAIEEIGRHVGRARVTFFDESSSRIWSNGGEERTSLSIIVAERRPIPDHFKLTISPHCINTTSPLVGIKSCNYLEQLLAFEDATGRGYHEAIRLNERGEVASACMANVFWEKDGKLFTPSLRTGCLPGTTREFVLENVDCKEVESGIEELGLADSIFLTSAGIGVVAAAEFEGRALATSSEHPLSGVLPF